MTDVFWAYERTCRVVYTVMPAAPKTLRPSGRTGAIAAGAGLGFAAAYAALLTSFPLFGDAESRARLQGAAVVALGFPTQLVYPLVAPFAWRVGISPFVMRIGLAGVNGVLWATLCIALWRTARRTAP